MTFIKKLVLIPFSEWERMKKTNSSINSMDMQEIEMLSKDKFIEREMNHNQNPITTSSAPTEEVVEDKKTPTTPLTPSSPIIQKEKVMEEKTMNPLDHMWKEKTIGLKLQILK